MTASSMISGSDKIGAAEAWLAKGALTVFDAPEGADAMSVAAAAQARGGVVVFVARDAGRAAIMVQSLRFFAPNAAVIELPSWDCLPYDRVSPSNAVSSKRMAVLSILAAKKNAPKDGAPLIVVTTINAALQRTPPLEIIAASALYLKPGESRSMDDLATFLAGNGYARASTVRDPGDFAIRGGLLDVYPPGAEEPVRLDFFGDVLETVRAFDAVSQRTTRQLPHFELAAASEILISDESIARFRRTYRELFGVADDDPLYEAISEGRQHAGMEHWLPLFYPETHCLFDFLGDEALLLVDHQGDEALQARIETISDHYRARAEDNRPKKGGKSSFDAPSYKPVPVERLYVDEASWNAALSLFDSRVFSPFSPPDTTRQYSFNAKVGKSFAAERAAEERNVFDAVVSYIDEQLASGKSVVISCWSEGSADRMCSVLSDHGVTSIEIAENWAEIENGEPRVFGAVLGLETGFSTDKFVFISEQDILGDRLVRRQRRKRAENFLTEASTLSTGDLVVHVEHGVARYEGLKTLEVQGAPHDCLKLVYHGGDKLFLPVENIDLLTRYGTDDPNAALDKLGGAAWQGRKAKMRARVKMLAEQLIAIAAKRAMRKADVLEAPSGIYDEFCARFPYAETEDQENAIADVIEDFAAGRPMDRLVCGDVGFGKTEVALRAAFMMAITGRQVAVIAPTTLLVRQHYKNFSERFKGFPIKVGHLSRMVSAKDATKTREGVRSGAVDIVVGTHALLAKTMAFRDLGLVVIDEEQHFGVKHKERLKEFRADTHVLTLTATPIPRTLQQAMTGIRDLSIIATPPVDRLAVRTTVGPLDPVVVRETLLREHYRGGQSFYVAPRIANLAEIAEFLETEMPELKYKVAHGQMAAGELEDIMTAFYEGRFDVLVSTTIIESGLDVPAANTMIVHNADLFGLAQLYQIRGRVGRSKQRAYCYLTTPARKALTPSAERRLKVLQSLDTLGAGFTLASHDLDIRGAGNLLGEEQSGQVREVGVELYQHMLEEAVAQLKAGGDDEEVDESWSPQINIGTAVLIPESFITDLDLRMALYRRLGSLSTQEEIDAFGAEMIDRFGRLPTEVEQLLEIVAIKGICKRAGIEKIDTGPKGAVITFRNNQFVNVPGLIEFVSQSLYDVKLRPDQKFVFRQNWPGEHQRLKGTRKIAAIIEDIANDVKN